MSLRRTKEGYKKGFTLAELLVVVAIIAILVAVSIPIFTGKLNEAKKNTDLANERAAKAAAAEYVLNGDFDSEIWNDHKDLDETYSSYYDAEEGILKKDWSKIKPYKKLISVDEEDGSDYDYSKQIIRVIVNKVDGLIIEWVPYEGKN